MEKPFRVEEPRLYEHGTALAGEARTTIRGVDDMRVRISPVSGCRTVDPSTVVYDRTNRREIAFVNLWSDAREKLLEAIRRDGVAVKVSGLDKWMGNGDCSATLLWAAGGEKR